MKNLFEQSRSHWVRYDHYELKTAEDGKRYITPGKNAKPDVYNPLKEVPNIVLDALNVGMLLMGRKAEAEVEKAVMEFVTRYGLLGLMTALPTTPTFMEYEAVYLPKNHFIKEESMGTDEYLSLFYPFDKLDLVKKGIFHKTTSQPGKESSYGGENNSPASNHAPKYRKNSVKEQNTTQIPLSNFVKRRRERLKISIYSHYREKQFPWSYAFIVATYNIAVNKNGKKAKPEKRVNGQKTSPKIALHGPAAAFFLPAQARSRKESHGVYRHLDQRLHSGKKICWT